MSELSLTGILKIAVKVVIVVIFAAGGFQISSYLPLAKCFPMFPKVPAIVVIIIIFGVIGLIFANIFWIFMTRFAQLLERRLQSVSFSSIFISLIGLLIGLLIAALISMPMSKIPGGLGNYISPLLYLVLGYLGLRVFYKRNNEIIGSLRFLNIFRIREAKKLSENITADKGSKKQFETQNKLDNAKILDTSAIIDGRILDVAKTRFLDGTIVLPRFILTELQAIADSSDPMRRTKGRRGLTIVTELQKLGHIKITIPETTLEELGRTKVDEALVVLAKRYGGKVVTTDYNLNKVAQIEGVPVLNVNDLANSLKPLLLPGEKVEIDIIRAGKDPHQGVGYLSDGTMLVVEDGSKHIGSHVKVTITSMLQTSAGRMIFGRIVVE